MARIRTVKPEFWRDEKVIMVQPVARLLFIGLLNFANDDGVLKDSPLQIKLDIFPADTKIGPQEVNKYLHELVKERMIVRYVADYKGKERPFLHIRGFTDHQYISRPTPSDLPGPPLKAELNQASQESSESSTGVVLPEGKGREGKGKEGITPLPPEGDEVGRVPYQEIIELWNKCAPIGLPRAKGLNDKRRKFIKAGWEGFPDLEHWVRVVEHIATNPHRMGHNDRGWKASIDFVFREWLKLSEELPEATPNLAAEPLKGRVTQPDQVTGDPDCPDCEGKGFIPFVRFGATLRRFCTCAKEVAVE